MGLDFLQTFLAKFFDAFKIKNPVLYAVLVSVLTGLQYFVQSGTIPIDPKITGWILWAIAIVLAPRTTSFLNSNT